MTTSPKIPLTLTWGRERYGRGPLEYEFDVLNVAIPGLPAPLKLLYIEVFARRSSSADLSDHFISFVTEQTSAASDGRRIELRSRLDDGVVIDHVLTAGDGEVDLRLDVHNPTDRASDLEYPAACLPTAEFTGTSRELGSEEFLAKCFITTGNGIRRLTELDEPIAADPQPFPDVVLRGQRWVSSLTRGEGELMNAEEVSSIEPASGLIGCFSADESLIAAVAWEPFHSLDQAALGCVHSHPWVGGVAPGESKTLRGKIYVVSSIPELLARHSRDFALPEVPAGV
jgi:hypothetical protein